MSDMPYDIRMESIEEARDILMGHEMSPQFFSALMMACPESMHTINKFAIAPDMNFRAAKDLLRDIAGIVLTKSYKNTPDYTPGTIPTADQLDWKHGIRAAGEEFVKDITEQTQMLGAIAYGK